MTKGFLLAAMVVLAGCGSSTNRAVGPPPPHLPRSLAHDFALRSEEIARRLDAGDPCSALDAAMKLQKRSIALIGRVPPAYQETLQGTINDIVARIRCVPPPPTPPTIHEDTDTVQLPDENPPKDKQHRGKGRGKHDAKDKEGD
jgi:hypothetical protein